MGKKLDCLSSGGPFHFLTLSHAFTGGLPCTLNAGIPWPEACLQRDSQRKGIHLLIKSSILRNGREKLSEDGCRKKGYEKEKSTVEFKPIQTLFGQPMGLQTLTWESDGISLLTLHDSLSKWCPWPSPTSFFFKCNLLVFLVQSVTTTSSYLIEKVYFFLNQNWPFWWCDTFPKTSQDKKKNFFLKRQGWQRDSVSKENNNNNKPKTQALTLSPRLE